VAGVTRSADKEETVDDEDDEEISDDTAGKKKKNNKEGSSSKSISILSRTTSEFDTCTVEKAVDFDPVQGENTLR
jgi:hypothetical protein